MAIKRTLRAPGSLTVKDPTFNMVEGQLVTYAQATDSITIPEDFSEANAVAVGNSFGGVVAIEIPVFNKEYWVKLEETKSAGDVVGAFTLMAGGIKGQLVPAQKTLEEA